MDWLTNELGTYYFVTHLANAFFSSDLSPEGGLVAEDLAKWPSPPEVRLFHYIDDILLTSDCLAELEKVVPQVLFHLKSRSRAVSKTRLQGPGLSVKLLGVVWSGKTKVIPDAVIDKIQVYLTPITVKQLQTFLGLLGYWREFVPHTRSFVPCMLG